MSPLTGCRMEGEGRRRRNEDNKEGNHWQPLEIKVDRNSTKGMHGLGLGSDFELKKIPRNGLDDD